MENESDTNSSSGRRWLYGFNVVALLLVALVILGMFFYFTNSHYWRKDMTSSGLYSLSGATKNLLQQIDAKDQTYTVISLYSGNDTNGQLVADLLDEYSRDSTHIKIHEGGGSALDEVERPIRKLYAGELKPYDETLGSFDALADELEKFFKSEGDNFSAVAQKPGIPNAGKAEAMQLKGLFSKAIPQQMGQVRKDVEHSLDSVSPDYSATLTTIKDAVEKFSKQLTMFSDPKQLKGQLADSSVTYFAAAQPRYQAMLRKIAAYKAKLDALKPLKVQDILDSIRPGALVVLGPTSAKVISPDDVFQAASGNAPPTFVGEQAMSSALLSMIQPDKVKVVFVTAVPQHLSTGPFSDMAKILSDSNFEVSDWSLPAPQMSPDQPPPDMTPPPQGKGVVWIVFPPPTPTEQQMMQGMGLINPAPMIDAVKKQLSAGGGVLFLAEAVSGIPMNGTDYAYAEVAKEFGVDVEPKYTVVHAISQQNPETGEMVNVATAAIGINRYSDHEITKTLDSLQAVFFGRGAMGYSGLPTVVNVSKTLPKNVEAQVIMSTPAGADYWGETEWGDADVMSPTAKYNPGIDLPSPLPMAVAAIKNHTQKDEQRIVVIGQTLFAANPFLEEADQGFIGSHLVSIQRYPGNSELIRNSVLWLAGYENMIAVSSKANAAARIGDVSDRAMIWIDWGLLYTGAPLAALILGGIVWMVRKR